MSQDEWVEPRGPHVPGAITRIPIAVWPFLALTTLAVYGRYVDFANLPDGSADLLAIAVASVPSVVAPLLGAALYLRHPEAHRTLPALTFGCVLFAAATAVDALRGPVLGSLALFPGDFDPSHPAVMGYGIVQGLVGVFAATYLALGLGDARRVDDRVGARGLLVALALLAIVLPLVSGFSVLSVAEPALVTIAVVIQILGSLALVFLGWMALQGWAAGEEPRRAWALASVGAFAQLAVGLLITLLNLLGWVTRSNEPLLIEFTRLLGLVLAAGWVALLAAFWLGLPAESGPAKVEDAEGRREPSL